MFSEISIINEEWISGVRISFSTVKNWDTSFVLLLWSCERVCMHACIIYVWVGLGLWLAVWVSDGVGVIWKWCASLWKPLVETFRTVLMVLFFFFLMLEFDVIYEVWIYWITIPRHKGRNLSKTYFWQQFSNSVKSMSSNMYTPNFIHLREIFLRKKTNKKTTTNKQTTTQQQPCCWFNNKALIFMRIWFFLNRSVTQLNYSLYPYSYNGPAMPNVGIFRCLNISKNGCLNLVNMQPFENNFRWVHEAALKRSGNGCVFEPRKFQFHTVLRRPPPPPPPPDYTISPNKYEKLPKSENIKYFNRFTAMMSLQNDQ